MSTRRVWNCTRQVAVVVLLAQLGCDACDPWPSPPPPPVVQYIAAFPDALDVLIDDPSRDLDVTLVGQAFDVYGRVVAHEPLQFTIAGSVTGLTLNPVSVPHDTTKLTVLAATTPTPVDRETVVELKHAATGLWINVPVHLRYAKFGVNGTTLASVNSSWPSVGLASGQASSGWQRNMLHAFVKRTGFGTFEPSDGTPSLGVPPTGDEASGSVLSGSYMMWRKTNPWRTATPDVTVPAAANPGKLPLVLVWAGSVATTQTQFYIDAQGGADIIEHTLTGVTVFVPASTSAGVSIAWTDNCVTLGGQVLALPPGLRPSTATLAVYMVKRSGVMGGDRGFSCGPGTMGVTTGADARTYAIFVPEGPVSSATIAHEIGHAFSLQHVTRPSGFFDNDLMVETDMIAEVLRSHLTVGQTFRAALDPNSWLVIAGVSTSAALDCGASPLKCPLLSADASTRTPP